MVAFILEKHLTGRSALAAGKSTNSHELALFTVAHPPHEPDRSPERVLPSQTERSEHQTGQDDGTTSARKTLAPCEYGHYHHWRNSRASARPRRVCVSARKPASRRCRTATPIAQAEPTGDTDARSSRPTGQGSIACLCPDQRRMTKAPPTDGPAPEPCALSFGRWRITPSGIRAASSKGDNKARGASNDA